jgi:hypothetical protein
VIHETNYVLGETVDRIHMLDLRKPELGTSFDRLTFHSFSIACQGSSYDDSRPESGPGQGRRMQT